MTKTLDRLIDGIPLTEYRDEDAGTARGVMFVVHGHTGERAHVKDLANRFAENGYLAVAVDAYKHGARREAPYGRNESLACTMAMPGVVLRTCADLAHLARTAYTAYAPLISFSGTSMGGHVAFQMPKHYPAKAIAPFIGSPDMMRHYAVTKSALIGLSELERLKDELDALEIGPDYDAYMKTRIVIANGLDDAVVDYRYAVDFHDALVRAGHGDVSIALYQVGHEVPAEMQEASIAALLD